MSENEARSSRRWWGLIALAVSALVIGFDATILNVALPTLARDLGADTGTQQWIIDAFMVAFAGCMLPAGLLGDRFGRRRLLMAGLGVFLAGALLGSLAGSPGPVIAARAFMGLGGALIMPLSMSMMPVMFPDAKERSRAIGVLVTGTSLGLPLGPLVGGWLLDHFWWGSVFLLNVPLVAIGLIACLLLLPESSDPSAPRVDTISAALSIGGLVSLVFAIIEAPRDGWGDPLVVGLFAASAVLLAALVLRSLREERPMLDLPLLADRRFLWNTVSMTLASLVLVGLLFLLPQYLQAVLGNDAFATGLRLMPLMLGLMVAGSVCDRIVPRLGARLVMTAGLLVLAAAALVGSRTDVNDGYGLTAGWLSVAGFGFGFAMVPAMDAAMSALPPARSGTGSGLLQTMRQVGGALGVAVFGSVLASVYTGRLDTGALPPDAADAARDSVVAAHLVADKADVPALAASANSAFVHGMDTVLLVCAIAAVAAAVLTAVFLPGRAAGAEVARDAGHDRESVA